MRNLIEKKNTFFRGLDVLLLSQRKRIPSVSKRLKFFYIFVSLTPHLYSVKVCRIKEINSSRFRKIEFFLHFCIPWAVLEPRESLQDFFRGNRLDTAEYFRVTDPRKFSVSFWNENRITRIVRAVHRPAVYNFCLSTLHGAQVGLRLKIPSNNLHF